ncbi:Stress-activated map kinase-interacting protein 1 [Cytospora mali]|uniref:Stress-activated map kinase-interacting protein 1 n=1 Tax=Cytospora mali TaxID=578113 RepID=A0A194VFT5_CYTMA|nr:Stress-activated map kinase-interacting protein 1 [Valsa mali var. pyri (nom. inval.)]
MSVIQVEDLVSYQLRASYLTEVADGVGERLITLNENFLNSAPFKAAGWRTNPALIKRTHSPPIPTAVASDYFQAPRQIGVNLEDEPDEGGMLTSGGNDTFGPGAATKRRRRREQMEEEDSSDLSDESEDEQDQRAAQQIKFAKMPVRHRSGSSPIQSSTLRQTTSASSPRPPPRRGSQSALETVKERARRDTVTSSEVSSENELEAGGYQRQRDAARAAAAKTVRIQTNLNKTEPSMGIKRQQSDLLEEEEEEEDDDSDASDMSSAFNESIESASILAGDLEKQLANISPTRPLIGTPPRDFKRQSTIRKSMLPPQQVVGGELPPRRPTSTIRPISMIQPKSLISEALNAKKTKPAAPFEGFATLSGKGESSPLMIRIYAPFSKSSSKPYEVPIRRTVREENAGDRPVNVADLIGLALWRYNDEGLEPSLPADKLNVNWWTLKMVEEGGEVDDDFPPLERTKPVISFATAANNKNEGTRPMAVMPRFGRGRSNTKIYDDFALVPATEDEFEANKAMTPQFTEESVAEDTKEEIPRNTPQPNTSVLAAASSKPATGRFNPVLTTTYRPDANMLDAPRPQASTNNTQRGQHKFLRIHIMTPDAPPGQMLTLDVTTDMYIEEVLELVCRKRNLDKNIHILKIPNSGAIALLDRPVSAIGTMQDLELHRRRFGDPTLSQSPAGHSPGGRLLFSELGVGGKKSSKTKGIHPLAKEALAQEELSRDNHYRRYVVYRKQTMRFAGLNERLFAIEGEYIHIAPSSGGKPLTDSNSKTTTVHFSNVVGCKLSRRHPSHFKVLNENDQFVIYREGESKRYDFETKSAEEASEIVTAIKHGTPTA